MARLALTLLLQCVGWLLARASRRRERFRVALSRDRVVAFETDDGPSFYFATRGRRFERGRGRHPAADFRLRCGTSRQALGVLLARDGLGRMLAGLAEGSIAVEGDLMLFMWFQGRLAEALPMARWRRHRRRFPGAYTRPRSDIAAARSIRREAPAAALDPEWTAAWKARDLLLMSRVAGGEPAPRF